MLRKTRLIKPKLVIPEKEYVQKGIESYIRKFDSLNGLKSVEYKWTQLR